MPPHEIFPLELVHQVIDELGEAHRWDLGFILPSTVAMDTKHSGVFPGVQEVDRCSRAHMFKKVKIEDTKRPARHHPTRIHPTLRQGGRDILRPSTYPGQASTPDLLKGFAMAQIEHLGITGGVLADKRACIQEFIDTHSTTLQTVKFKHCSLSAYNIADIVLGRHRLRRLRLDYCECEQLPPPGRPLITDAPDPDTCSKPVELELRLSGGDPEEGPVDIVAMVAQLPYRFSRLDVEHVAAGYGATKATNALIKANADVLSSLRIRIWAGMFGFLSRKMMLLIVISTTQKTWRLTSSQNTCSVLRTVQICPS
jgi:hypothetical protein